MAITEIIIKRVMMEKKLSAKEIKKLDKIWADDIKKRDKYVCQVCKHKADPKGLHAHHIIPRQFEKFRHWVTNGMTLCYSCHKVGKYSAHQNPLWFDHWLSLEYPNIFQLMKGHAIDLEEKR